MIWHVVILVKLWTEYSTLKLNQEVIVIYVYTNEMLHEFNQED